MQLPATMIDYKLMAPPPDLAGYIKFYWTLQSLPNNGNHYIFRTMANGCPVLFFHYCGQVHEARINADHGPSFRAGIYGATEKTKRFRLPKNFGIFGLCLYPFAVPQLFNIPSSEITNHVVSLTELMGSEGRDLEDQVMLCDSTSSRMEMISRFIRSKIFSIHADTRKFSHAISNVIHAKGHVRIPELADDYCLSRRTFERRFRELSGLSPKTYSNVIRFQSAFDELTAQNSSLTEVAYQCGYYDQSHFTNDFTKFSGFNPKNFTTNDPCSDPLWLDFVAFFQFLSWCPPVLCSGK
jgi:AraC-like DNA-binding protein